MIFIANGIEMDSILSSWEKWGFDLIVNKLQETFFTPKTVDIFELTFAYDSKDGKLFNRTLFTDFAWLSIKNTQEELFSITNSLLHIKKMYIQQARKDIVQLPKIDGKSEILLGTLGYIEKILDLTILWLPFEIEKIWYPLLLSPQDVEQRVKKMEAIEATLFGGNIRENPLEVANCYRSLKTKIDKKIPMMTERQRQLSKKVLDTIKNLPAFIDVDGIFKNRQKDTRDINYKKIITDNKTLLEKKISREDYVKIFELVFALYGIEKTVKIDERTSIYDGEDALYIPNNKNYETLNLQKILSLIQHEIERHMISLENNQKNLGWFRWWYNLFMEEWTAMIMEWILQWKSLSEYGWMSINLPNLLVGELLDGEEYKEFLSIFSSKEVVMERKKRLYPKYYRGVQHKDTVYTRWPKAVISYITRWWNPKDTFLWRLQEKDISKIQKNTITKYPKLVAEVILYKLINNTINDSEFKEFIRGKYDFLDEESIKDKMNNFTFDQKKQLIEVFKIIKK